VNKKEFSHTLSIFTGGILNSYSQIFFSNNRLLALLLLMVTFFDLGAGMAGILSVIIVQLLALFFRFDETAIKNGIYAFNALMVGVAMGVFYEFNFSFFLLLIVTSLLTFFLTIWFYRTLGNYNLPFLSLPFLAVIWAVILGGSNFSALQLQTKEVISLFRYFPELFGSVTAFIAALPFAHIFMLYFRSLGAIYFQFNDLAGIIIAMGLIFTSRISFVLSVFGFLLGFAFYSYYEGDFTQLVYSYIGFNFILTAIALGGFFFVASRKSFFLVLLVIPVIALLISALHTVFSKIGLPLYSLPFNIVVLLSLSAMAFRNQAAGLHFVTYQQFSPEKNHYSFFNHFHRFGKQTQYQINLPVHGAWYISQGHNGKITHLGEWSEAWDFDVRDKDGKSFHNEGVRLKDFYCYDLPVVAPAKGQVVKVLDGIHDNNIGDVNLTNNWGNTIIIKHGDYLYSKLSHLKSGSIKVREGEAVENGQLLATVGNSGRSPEPHLHYQLQATPYIGSKTIRYPISLFLSENGQGYKMRFFDIPSEGETVKNVSATSLLTNAFALIPGTLLQWREQGSNNLPVQWEVLTDAYNRTYILCRESGATAWFHNGGPLFYFYDYSGTRNTLLYHFYQGAFKMMLAYHPGITLDESMAMTGHFHPLLQSLHDLTTPFFRYCKVNYRFEFVEADDEKSPENLTVKGSVASYCCGKAMNQKDYLIGIDKKGLAEFKIVHQNKTFVCVR
jgi:urea transporter/murein DD-endopeptidase MepM/ murein hydrolase activator NlpD